MQPENPPLPALTDELRSFPHRGQKSKGHSSGLQACGHRQPKSTTGVRIIPSIYLFVIRVIFDTSDSALGGGLSNCVFPFPRFGAAVLFILFDILTGPYRVA